MKEKEAREIVAQFKDAKYIFENVHPNAKAYFLAEGWLECHAKAAKMEEALKKISDGDFHACSTDYDYACGCAERLAEEALDQWKKEG